MKSKSGILFVGLCGHLSTITIAGAIALSKKLCPATGMVTHTRPFKHLPFKKMSDFIFGGWDIRPLKNEHNALKDIGIENFDDIIMLSHQTKKIQENAFPGILLNSGQAISDLSATDNVCKTDSIRDAIDIIGSNIDAFKSRHDIDHVIVINLASTEPPLKDRELLSDMASINHVIDENRIDLIRPSFIYSYAAITKGCAYINFTPSEAGSSDGLAQLSRKFKVPVMGCDGKTGETLVKSALAPMFAHRNLDVLSWEGYNILGNLDGKVLHNKENGKTKIKSKDRLLPHILGYSPHSKVTIDYVPSLGDRKTAWDFIHFQGFLNTKMTMQFTWQGCDSALAAPLVLDLARFGILALEKGQAGVMTHLASFFKSPWQVKEHSLEKQFQMLEAYAQKI